MISSISFFRINVLAWRATAAYSAKSQPTQYLQKCFFRPHLSDELTMNFKNGTLKDTKRGKRKPVKQAWRAVSTQSSSFESDGVKGESQSQLQNIYHATSSTTLTAKCENTDSEDVNKPVHADTCINLENNIEDRSLDGSMTVEKYSMSMNVGQSLLRFIIGKGRGTQKEIEEETGVKIVLPSSRKEECIIIEGNSVESVNKASEKVQIIIDKAVNSRALDYSHFVSLPLAIYPGLVDKLTNFQNTILQIVAYDNRENPDSDTIGDNEYVAAIGQQTVKAPQIDVVVNAEKDDTYADVNNKIDQHSTKTSVVSVEVKDTGADAPVKVNIANIPLISYDPKNSKTPISKSSSSKLRDLGIEKSIFIKPKTFHLTILMLKLWNKERVTAAAEVLQSVSLQVMDALDNRPVTIKLKGLDCMKGSLAKARVLYAPVEVVGGEDRLLRATQVIIDAFAEAGLLIGTDAQQKLKLHATVMNARHRKRNNNTKKLDSFDARGIFDRYGSEEWGEYPLREAHLSQRFVFDENGYYHCCASIPFPDDMQVE